MWKFTLNNVRSVGTWVRRERAREKQPCDEWKVLVHEHLEEARSWNSHRLKEIAWKQCFKLKVRVRDVTAKGKASCSKR